MVSYSLYDTKWCLVNHMFKHPMKSVHSKLGQRWIFQLMALSGCTPKNLGANMPRLVSRDSIGLAPLQNIPCSLGLLSGMGCPTSQNSAIRPLSKRKI
ncbi:hypothetical protein PM3016_4392 [Paenibacillus mucilaginosus 3016]|uniref:Uncharacterized protein n=1 Tax=Paenibacillus mucilaginosus 3016 TaxID=1116391 RepID=H6NPW7_9BACL|nr:hypothetical protein PM3016_4392 [Paenibacillus mucilaginosus 3016]